MAPWRGGRGVRHDDIAALPAERRRVIAYWRPGCAYCTRLRRALGTRGTAVTWINIWQDQAAEDFVRSVNDGNATVPTVVIGGGALTNPDPRTVLRHLS
ncbi:glutathione S-transferase N-terminal domain-containing protein [Spiractinospora alimapuensis]|nr:glutathione S-transferase N-terminal domain-containing protein [Spiractinospora alimapuensis]